MNTLFPFALFSPVKWHFSSTPYPSAPLVHAHVVMTLHDDITKWKHMIMSSNGNIFRVTGPLRGESASNLTKASDALMFSLICA